MRLYQAPTQNLVYADASGDIGFISPGLVPLRKSGDGLAPTDGASGATDWIGFVPFEQLPQLHNPPVGFVFNANNAIVAPDREPDVRPRLGGGVPRPPHPAVLRSDPPSTAWKAPPRCRRITPSLAALTLLPLLESIKPNDERAHQALALLAGWGGVMDKDRPEPLIFEAFSGARCMRSC